MTLKEYGEEADINIQVTVTVNDEVAYLKGNYSIDDAIACLLYAERHNVIQAEIEKQYQDLPEPIEDEETGRLY